MGNHLSNLLEGKGNQKFATEAGGGYNLDKIYVAWKNIGFVNSL